jgi:hypothetical protein
MVQVHAPQGVEVRVLSWAPQDSFSKFQEVPEKPRKALCPRGFLFFTYNLASKARQYVGSIIAYAIHNNLREDGIPLALQGILRPTRKAISLQSRSRPTSDPSFMPSMPIGRRSHAALKLTRLSGLRPGVVASAPWTERRPAHQPQLVAADNRWCAHRVSGELRIHPLREQLILVDALDAVFGCPPVCQVLSPRDRAHPEYVSRFNSYRLV